MQYGIPGWIRNRKRTSVESFDNCTVCVKDITHSRGNWVKHIWCECLCIYCCPRSLLCCLYFFFFLFILFSIFRSVAVVSTILSCRSFICSVSVIYYWFLLVYYSSVCLFFSPSRSLVNISCILSIVFSRPWIIFTFIILNYFSGRLPISTSFSCFSGVLSCPFIWDTTFCFFILIYFL